MTDKKFLPHAQTLAPLIGEVDEEEIITSLDDRFFTMGSCFAQNIQRLLEKFSFNVFFDRRICAHYSSRSIRETLDWIVANEKHDDSGFFEYAENDIGSYRHFRVRKYGEDAKQQLFDEINSLDVIVREEIKQANIFLFTLGTTMTWRKNETGHSVCTFFGMPVGQFDKYDLTIADIKDDIRQIYQNLKSIKGTDDFKVMFTISPQRYYFSRDHTEIPTLQFNTFSKAKLNVALHEFIQSFEGGNITYFPSYEMVIDELRPYETMSNYDHMHIRQQHTPEYVVKRFLEAYATPQILECLEVLDKMGQLIQFTKARMNNGAEADSEHIKPSWMELLGASSFKELCNSQPRLQSEIYEYLSSLNCQYWLDE